MIYFNKSSNPKMPFYIKARDGALDPYRDYGCHPDVVIRIWDEIGKTLPTDCRCLIGGTPALAHPKHGIVLALGLGTEYAIRVPTTSIQETKKLLDASDSNRIMEKIFDFYIQREIGEDWIYGDWKEYEVVWCNKLYEQYNQ